MTLYELTNVYINSIRFPYKSNGNWLNEHESVVNFVTLTEKDERGEKEMKWLHLVFNENQQETNQRESNERKIKPNMKLTSPSFQFRGICSFVLFCFAVLWFGDDNTQCKKKAKNKMLTNEFSARFFWSLYQQQKPLQYHLSFIWFKISPERIEF